jgi:5-hydroxyisourate hydrolase-like protein (transthyretin family)
VKATAIATSIFMFPLEMFGLCFVPGTPCQWYAQHHGQPTFIGTAVAAENVPDVLHLDVVHRGERALPVTVQKVTFKVEEPFEDTPSTVMTVYGVGTTNDFHFKVGVQYLVYGWREKDGKVRTEKCTRTAPVVEAADDLRFLRALPSQVGGKIFGLVRSVSPGTKDGTVTGMITEAGNDGNHKARVDTSGSYELNALAPGDYRQTFTTDDNGTEFVWLKLRIPIIGSCAESGVALGNTTVSGSVIDQVGTPIQNVDVSLFYALDGRFHPDLLLQTRTDAIGRFTFHRVESAKYILATELGIAGMTFFPGTRDALKTHVIEVSDGNPLSGLTIRVRAQK